jgi:bidirectional [NiFe] hydrogenase diaphorase subunit
VSQEISTEGLSTGGRPTKRRVRTHGLVPLGPTRASIHVCEASGCRSLNSEQAVDALAERLTEAGVTDVAVKRTGCLGVGLCARGPLARIDESGEYFEELTADNLQGAIDALAAVEPGQQPTGETSEFASRQLRVAMENFGLLDPEDLNDYLARGGYDALQKALHEMTPGQVIAEVSTSGLRGRGGGGFPTGLKWTTVAKAAGPDGKYVICNADEGDPGAFMDRTLLESDPHRVIEGMAIAAYAVGASEGYIYCRAEYPLAVKRLRHAIRQGEREGILGKNIFDTRFSFEVDVRLGAGAFVCGEETALIRSIQGGRGTPRPRPPYPALRGLHGRPTLLNNVETFAAIAPIVRNGGAWYASIGTPKSTGTKVFALAGRVKNTGIVEVPMGITLREVVYDIGGGITDDHPFKAVQTGGPSGGCIPAEFLDMPLDYESLAEKGSIMGSGGMIIMDDTACMVDVAKFFMEFCVEESCGKCVPCRVGTTHMHNLLAKIAEGEATMDDLAALERLAGMVKATSLCGLGQTAPNPVFSTLRYFRHEYLAHIEDRQCPANVCPVAQREVAGV